MEPQEEVQPNLSKVILWLVVIALVIVAALWISWGRQGGESEAIKIGVIAPQTGSFAIFGERIRNGIELARSDLGVEGQVSVIYEDACQPKDAVSAAKKLIQVDNVAWIGGSFCLVGFVPVIPIAEEGGVLAFNTAANPDATLGHPYVFSTNKSIKADAKVLAEFARKLGAKTAASLFYVTPLGEDYGKYFKLYFEELGGKVVSSERVQLDATDFRTELTKIKSAHPDLIFVVHLAKPLGTFLKQARELGLTSTILSHSEAEDPNVLEVAGKAGRGYVYEAQAGFGATQRTFGALGGLRTAYGTPIWDPELKWTDPSGKERMGGFRQPRIPGARGRLRGQTVT